jgi:AAA family ATP:ADP antiporter
MTASPHSPNASVQRENRLRREAFLLLAGVMAAHALLETARDALFLGNLPVEELPFVYLAIAAVTLVTARISAPIRTSYGNKKSLFFVLVFAATGTALGNALVSRDTSWAYQGLYVWSTVASSLVVLNFWLTLADRLTITQGKRLYAGIAMGGSIGALVGFASAALLAFVIPTESLILVSAGIFALCAIGSLVGFDDTTESSSNPESTNPSEVPGLIASIRRMGAEPYSRGVALLAILSTVSFTLADYLFKSFVASEVAKEDLAGSLASIYLVLNLSSTLVLAFIATPLLRRIGLQRSLAVLPIFFVLGGFGFVMGLAMAAIGLLKTSEGVLRHSLHRIGSELLYLPMSADSRNATKTFSAVVGDKGAKALASLAILALIPWPGYERLIALALMGLASAWIATAFRLRGPYLDVFRRTLGEDTIKTRIELPDLDLGSLETLIHALNHHDDRYVSTAISLLQDRERADLIPSLILYHPSDKIVEQALEVFSQAGRSDIQMHIDRLLDHESACIRAATTRAIGTIDPNRVQLEALAESDCPCIRISAVSGLLRHDWIDQRQAILEFEAILGDPRVDPRRALARSAMHHYSSLLRSGLEKLALDEDQTTRNHSIEAIRRSGDDYFTKPLVGLLAERTTREAVRVALIERGHDAITALAEALLDADTSNRVRNQIPTTLARFRNTTAADVLLETLTHPASGLLRFKVLSALRRLLADPIIRQSVDTSIVEKLLMETTARAVELLEWQVALGSGQIQFPDYKTRGGELLLGLLHDKERLAVSRIFILLDLLHAEEDFDEIRVGMTSEKARVQASSIELLENLLPSAQAMAILALVMPAPSSERLNAVTSGKPRGTVGVETLVETLVGDRSASLSALARYYASEIDLEIDADGQPIATSSSSRSHRDPATRHEDSRASALVMLNELPEGSTSHV